MFWNDTPAGVHVRSHRVRICLIIAITFQIPIAQHISFVFPIICDCGSWRVVDAYLFGNVNVNVRENGGGGHHCSHTVVNDVLRAGVDVTSLYCSKSSALSNHRFRQLDASIFFVFQICCDVDGDELWK